MLHIHVLLVGPLGAGYMAQPGADQHEGRIAVAAFASSPAGFGLLEIFSAFLQKTQDLAGAVKSYAQISLQALAE